MVCANILADIVNGSQGKTLIEPFLSERRNDLIQHLTRLYELKPIMNARGFLAREADIVN